MGETLARTGGEVRGLIALRIILVVVTVAGQSVLVSDSFTAVLSTPLWIVPAVSVSALFALSGLTLAQTRARTPAPAFLLRRARSTLPAVIAVVAMTLGVVGPLTTILGTRAYLLDPVTWLYALNIVAIPRFTLPGVFAFNDLADVVNTIVWTIPTYVALALVVALLPPDGHAKRWAALLAAPPAAAAVLAAGWADTSPFVASALGALACGLLGAAAHGWRARLPIDGRAAAAALVAIAGAAVIGDRFWAASPVFNALVSLPVTYAALWAATGPATSGLGASRAWNVLRHGLLPAMLAAFPIQQAVIALGPRAQNAAVNLALSAPAVLVVAAAIGFLASRPILAGPPGSQTWASASGAPPRRRVPLRDVLTRALVAVTLGTVLMAIALALLALAFFAMQRDQGGL